MKNTVTKTGNVGRARAAQKRAAKQTTAGVSGSTNKYESIGDVMRASAKGALPRGAKFVIRGGRVQLRVETRLTGVTLYDGDAAEVARWGLRKAGMKADFAA
jgi:hypothetical protein